MSTYVLIHGDWHGGWCWEKVVPLLEQTGHHVFAPDLPGHGEDKTPLSTITPESVVQRISDILDTQEESVILVGHSSGGILLTLLAGQRPERIKKLVYLSAFLLPAGVWPNSLGEDTESILQSSLVVDEERQMVMVKQEAAKEVFYADCTDEDAAWATRLLVPEPLRTKMKREAPPQTTLTNTLVDSIPRFYITCLHDKALGPATQKKMYTVSPCQKIYSLLTSHSPFLSAPAQLAACLLDLASL
jgi:pimeloyl-ACP methyl ester carboxylesterase